jgi:hypothetical protein
MPAATAAAEPPEEPPATRSRACGFRVGPWWLFWVEKTEGVLVHVERAETDGAGRREPLDHHGVPNGRWAASVDARACDGRQTRYVEQVLDRVGDARERPRISPGGAGGVDRGSLGQRSLARDGGEGVDRRVAGADAVERVARDGDGARRSAAHERGGLQKTQPGACHSSSSAGIRKTGAASIDSGRANAIRAAALRSSTLKTETTTGTSTASILTPSRRAISST